MSGPVHRANVLTPAGRGAVAVVRAEGPAAAAVVDQCFRAANGRRLREQPVDRVVFGHWATGHHREEVIVIRGSGDQIEIHCHGGAAASGRIVTALQAGGCEIEPWQEWVERASPCRIVAEAELALAAATTRRAAAILLEQRHGALARDILAAQQELDRGDRAAAQERLAALLARSTIGMHLTQPWQLAIAGRPNVGKSSLINALVGYQRAIVFDQPGTTRDVLTAETAIDGWPVRLTDAAGIRRAADSLEAEGVARARQQLSQADLVLWVLDGALLDATAEANIRAAAERELGEELGNLGSSAAPIFVVVNKVDLISRPPHYVSGNVTATSALTGAGINALLAVIARRLVPSSPAPGVAVPFTERQAQLLERALAEVDAGELEAVRATLALL